jgi:hypothetical protein
MLVSGPPETIEGLAGKGGEDDELLRLGEVAGEALELTAGVATLSLPVEQLRTPYRSGLSDRFS